jgi:peptidoglycan/LPS O-acetylase OafA/YrhL
MPMSGYDWVMLTERGVRVWLLLAVVALLAQQALTTYSVSQRGAGVFWLALSLALLWFVHRRSNVARIAFAAMAAVGFAIFVLAAIDDANSTATLLALLYGVQTGTMLVSPVRAWTRAHRSDPVISPVK